jgi:hypothetical protein
LEFDYWRFFRIWSLGFGVSLGWFKKGWDGSPPSISAQTLYYYLLNLARNSTQLHPFAAIRGNSFTSARNTGVGFLNS